MNATGNTQAHMQGRVN